MRALDHAVETLYAESPSSDVRRRRPRTHWPRSSRTWLRRSTAASLTDRLHCQTAAWMSVRGLAYAGLGLSHALGHQIGPRWNVAHGVTSCIILPHAMRAVAGRVPDRFQSIATALGVAFDTRDPAPGARACADAVAAFVSRLGLPRAA
jgi:alcohol dehydrogenase